MYEIPTDNVLRLRNLGVERETTDEVGLALALGAAVYADESGVLRVCPVTR